MAEEQKEESYLDTVSAAVAEQKAEKPQVEPGPEIAKPEEPAPEAREEEVEPHAITPPVEGRERDEHGRYKAKAAAPETDRPLEDKPEEPEEVVQPETGKPDITRPPRRLPLRTRAAWLQLPEAAREDIILREQEFDKAFKRYDGLGQFANKAEQNGTTLHQAVASYHQMETMMRQNPIDGAIAVWRATGHDPAQVLSAIVGMGGGQPAPAMQMPQGLTREDMQAELERQFVNRDVQTKLSDFEKSHPYLEELIPGEPLGTIRATMVGFMANVPGLADDLEGAYSMALKAHGIAPGSRPNGSATPAGQSRAAAAVDRSRQAAKAAIGAPSQGSNAKEKAPDEGNLNWIDTVKAAYNKAKRE